MFTILSITGGVPWYLEQILPHVTIDANIKRLAFEKDGLFTLEFEKIFHDLYHVRSPVYSEIIRILSTGMKTLEELRTELGYARSGTLSQMIKALMRSGFVTAHHSWMIKTEKISKKGLYRLSDNYLCFFLKYIEPNLSNIEKGGCEELSLSALPGWKSIDHYYYSHWVCIYTILLQTILIINVRQINIREFKLITLYKLAQKVCFFVNLNLRSRN